MSDEATETADPGASDSEQTATKWAQILEFMWQVPAGTASAPGGVTVWLTGLPSAGKSTIARAVADRLRAAGRRVEILDGDDMRRFLSAGLGFSKEDRDTNVRRIGFVAELLASHGVTVLVPVIAPYACSRTAVREHHAAAGTPYLEAYIATPVWICAERDVKGLYSAQAEGRLTALTGIDDPYEVPVDPDTRIPAHEQTVAESAEMLFGLLVERGLAYCA